MTSFLDVLSYTPFCLSFCCHGDQARKVRRVGMDHISTISPWHTEMKPAAFHSIMAVSCKFCRSSLLAEGHQLSKPSPVYGFMSASLHSSSVCEVRGQELLLSRRKCQINSGPVTWPRLPSGQDQISSMSQLPFSFLSPATLKWWVPTSPQSISRVVTLLLCKYFLRTHSAHFKCWGLGLVDAGFPHKFDVSLLRTLKFIW